MKKLRKLTSGHTARRLGIERAAPMLTGLIINRSKCCCGGGSGGGDNDGGHTVDNSCRSWCGDGIGIPCDMTSKCFKIDLTAYQPSDPFQSPRTCKWAFGVYQICAVGGACSWLGAFCNCCPDYGPSLYHTCTSCDFGCGENNTEGEGTVAFQVQMDILCPNNPFWSYHFGISHTYYDADGNAYNTGDITADLLAAAAAVTVPWVRLVIAGDDFFPFSVVYKCLASTFKCRGANTFTKVFADPNYAVTMPFPASITIHPSTPFCDVP